MRGFRLESGGRKKRRVEGKWRERNGGGSDVSMCALLERDLEMLLAFGANLVITKEREN